MSKLLKLLCAIGIAISLTACSEKTTQEPTESTPVISEEKKEVASPAPVITFAEFDKKYERNPDRKSYQDGVFLLQDGTRINADYIQYIDYDGFFNYASAIYYEGKLANLKIETTKSIEEVEKGLGITVTDNIDVNPTRVGFEITFDERFKTDNIDRFPNEWD